MNSPFTLRRQDLPAALPVFPLPGAIVLPRSRLPLNIFEPRYLNMTLDALGEARLIGMIQPRDVEAEVPPLHAVGCAGRIVSFSETADDRLLITLLGVCRFMVAGELDPHHGYRRVTPDWSSFAGDLYPAAAAQIDRTELLEAAGALLAVHNVRLDTDALNQLDDAGAVDALAMQLPLSSADKQALLETADATERARVLTALCRFSAVPQEGGTSVTH